MYVAGSRSASRAAVAALRTCIRSWSTRKSGSPRSLSAITSPSTSRSRSPSGLRLSSGQATVTGFSLRLSSRVVPLRVVSASTRTPSHFTSCDQPGSVGTWVPVVASIGRMAPSLPIGLTDGFSPSHRSHWSHPGQGGPGTEEE